jgi:hypothetical protein
MSGERNILRRFNTVGIAEFVRRIEMLRAGGAAEIDDAFVTDAKLTEPVVPEVPIERPAFKTKRDAGAYLSERTRAARAVHGDDDRGLWTWLSAWHWDAVCPTREDGSQKVLAPYSYIFGHLFAKRKTQHLLAVAVRLFDAATNSRLLLDTPVNSLTSLVEQVSTRLSMTRIRGFFDLLDLLYFDPRTGKAKPGVVDARTVRPGDLRHRLTARIRQLEVTYDLTNLNAEQLLNLLGDEFRQWAVTPAATPSTPRQPRRPASGAPSSHPTAPPVPPS